MRGENQLRFFQREWYAKMGASVNESAYLLATAQHNQTRAEDGLTIGKVIPVAQYRVDRGKFRVCVVGIHGCNQK
ncbi:MAG: hypothetical protein RIR79_1447 [Pseudomonadota bacterium]